MREEVVRVFHFDELSEEARESARQWWRESNISWDIASDQIVEDYRYELSELGYPTDKIEFSLSYRQGDGMAFYGDIDVEKLCKAILTETEMITLYHMLPYLSMSIVRNHCGHHYSHYNCMDLAYDFDESGYMMDNFPDFEGDEDALDDKVNEVTDFLDDIFKQVENHIKETSQKLESDGYKMLDYYDSNEFIDEGLIINEYEFTESGKRWRG